MKSSTQPSFRRIMLLRILIVSIPILLIGVAVAFRKARTSLLYTARQNLAESAIRKAETVNASVQSLQTGVVAASESLVLRAGDTEEMQGLLEDLVSRGLVDTERSRLNCLELWDGTAGTLQMSVCDPESEASSAQAIAPTSSISTGSEAPVWPPDRTVLTGDRFPIQRLLVDVSASDRDSNGSDLSTADSEPRSTEPVAESELRSRMDAGGKLNVVVETPVYDADNALRYTLRAEAQLAQIENVAPKSLLGYTLIVREDGMILAHPLPERIGTYIGDTEGGDRFESAIRNALRGEQDVRHLFNLTGHYQEWLAGYSAVDIAVSPTQNETWVVLAVTPLDSALQGLQDIKRILIILTGMLLVAHLSAVLYTARDLARPLEQLGQYASHIHDHQTSAVPKNFRIREINHLAEVLEAMVKSLEDRAEDLELARQEAENANQLKSEFLANTSHELRTPLNAIIGCIRLIQDGCCDDREEELEFLDRADQSAIHLLKIINDLLDVAKIEAGTLTLSVEPVNVSEVLRNVVHIQTVEAQRKGLWLQAEPLVDGIMVNADIGKLKQVLLNIIYNAVKFTDQGGITVTPRILWGAEDEVFDAALQPLWREPSSGVEPTSTAGSESPQSSQPVPGQSATPQPWLAIAITDTGIGIDPSQQHKLFRPFVMVDGSTTRKFEGTGLGLSISRNLVELMNGTITLTSDGLNQGTTVTITLPIVQLPAERPASCQDVLSNQDVSPNGAAAADTPSSSAATGPTVENDPQGRRQPPNSGGSTQSDQGDRSSQGADSDETTSKPASPRASFHSR